MERKNSRTKTVWFVRGSDDGLAFWLTLTNNVLVLSPSLYICSWTMLYTDIKISTLMRMMMSHSRKPDFLYWRISWRNRMLCCGQKKKFTGFSVRDLQISQHKTHALLCDGP